MNLLREEKFRITKLNAIILQDLAMHKIKVWGKIVAINELSALLMLLKWLCQVKLQQNIETQRNSAREVLYIVGCWTISINEISTK